MNENTAKDDVKRDALSVVSLEQADDEKEFWLTQSPVARFRHILYLRKMNYGDGASGRLQRVLEVADGPSS
jgi:hypothetical protein